MKTNYRRAGAVLLLAALVLFAGFPVFAGGSKEVPQAAPGQPKQFPKYVFLFIGDGMAMPQINSAEIYSNAVASKDIAIKKLRFSRFPVAGMTTTYEAGSFITDSASAGTAMATGNKTLSGVINMDPGKTKKFTTIAETAKAAGYRIGIVSSVSLDHATPAAFYAKVPSRGNMYDIAVQLAASNFDYFGGGGFVQPKGKKGDQPDAFEFMSKAGYSVVNSKKDFEALKKGVSKVVAINETLQDSMAMPYEIDRSSGDLSLADYTKKGIELLENDKGFFMMVEGGKIDWACHANDAAASIKDVLAFDEAVAAAVTFSEKHPDDTLIVVTGDHETGGMTIGFAGTKYSTFFDKIAPQKGSFTAFDMKVLVPYKKAHKDNGVIADLLPTVEDYFGVKFAALSTLEQDQLEKAFVRSMKGEVEKSVREQDYLLYGGYEPFTVKLTQILNQKAGIGWTTYSHTGVPVATFALGAGQELFGGYYDNTDIYKKLFLLMRLKTQVAAN